MPLVSIVVGDPSTGRSLSYLLECQMGVNYQAIQQLLSSHLKEKKESSITRAALREILSMAQSDRERELIRYTAFVSGNFTQNSARRLLGLEGMNRRVSEVEKCMREARDIRESIEQMAQEEIRNLTISCSDSEEESKNSDSENVKEVSMAPETEKKLVQLLKNSDFNWFELVSQAEASTELEADCESLLHKLYSNRSKYCFTEKEIELIEQSYSAFQSDDEQYAYGRQKMERIVNGEIVTDSESDNPDLYSKDQGKALRKKVEALKRSARRRTAKRIASRKYLQRSCSRRIQNITTKYPDIGTTIENFVQECNVGADAWRRTGILTFDGNVKVKKKATYNRIKEHLETKYGRHFSYGTVVELCVARNKRRKSSHRYKGAAKVTSRRARKGFTLRYNPDSHWSSALYRGLNNIQYTDGKNILNINRDDASGFRLDTLSTHKQYQSLSVQGKEVLTTHTDYVNKYKSVLQTTSYNFTGTKTTGEMCAGIVKAHGLYQKNPAQHSADLKMLMSIDELNPTFINTDTNQPKQIACIRVDGASDEGPTHQEVQFWWTEYHLTQGNYITLVTTRSSGSSYLNRVELQNGCLTKAHSNLFIPSTLKGSCTNDESGALNQERLKENLELATDVYINRCNGCSCGDTMIHLFKGADSSKLQKLRPLLNIFLKGSQQKRRQLQISHPEEYSFFNTVWSLRNRHIVTGLPEMYMLCLRCCFDQACVHPLCQQKDSSISVQIPSVWYVGGPPTSFIPLPVVDVSRPWGRPDCEECHGFCHGHYQKPGAMTDNHGCHVASPPPSTKLQQFFVQLKGRQPREDELTSVAKAVLLPVSEVKLWLNHLQEVHKNRQRGAAKAAETRRAKRTAKGVADCTTAQLQPFDTSNENQEEIAYCGVCNGPYQEETEDVEDWICCDNCKTWFHWVCIGISEEPKSFLCNNCK